jgi:hypothetical protein
MTGQTLQGAVRGVVEPGVLEPEVGHIDRNDQ